MAGTKGRSGGARPGAGRKPKAKVDSKSKPKTAAASAEQESHVGASNQAQEQPVALDDLNMLEFLQGVARGKVKATSLQVRAAIAAVQYTHTKRGDGGKKEDDANKAKKAAGGRFSSAPPPLKLINKK